MIERLKVTGYQSLVDVELRFTPLTILLGRNGAGKSALLDSLERVGSYARGGAERAFGAAPYSLRHLRSHGYGTIDRTSFEIDVKSAANVYRYRLAVRDQDGRAEVSEERVTRVRDGTILAAWSAQKPPASRTILRPDPDTPNADSLEEIASYLRSVRSFDLNPRAIEQPSEEGQSTLNRDGFGVGAFLAKLQESEPSRFDELQRRIIDMRPGMKALNVRGGAAGQVYWGVDDDIAENWSFQAPLISWGDRLLVGIVCAIFAIDEGRAVALEEIDRGFHPSRYRAVVELLSEAAYHGVGGRGPIQIIATSHSPALVSHFQDRLDELRLVHRAKGGVTTITSMKEEVQKRLGATRTSAPIGEVWAMGLLD